MKSLARLAAVVLGLACGSLLAAPASADVLVVGDSISLGWQPALSKMLPGETFVHAEYGELRNSQGTKSALRVVDGKRRIDWWVDQAHEWDLVIYNFGIWDMRPDGHGTTPDEYKANLMEITGTLETLGVPLIYLTTTPVPTDHPTLDPDRQSLYREAELAVSAAMGTEVIDLYAATVADFESLRVGPGDLHFAPEGSAALANVLEPVVNATLSVEGAAAPEPGSLLVIAAASGVILLKPRRRP